VLCYDLKDADYAQIYAGIILASLTPNIQSIASSMPIQYLHTLALKIPQ